MFVEYAKASAEDILIRITAHNRGPEAAPIHLLPTIWFRNTWSWKENSAKPEMKKAPASPSVSAIALQHPQAGKMWLHCQDNVETLFTENETNAQRLYGAETAGFAKDGINDHVVSRKQGAVNPAETGTKAAAHYQHVVPAGDSVTIKLRLTKENWPVNKNPLDADFDRIFVQRIREADEFYEALSPESLSKDGRNVLRQALAGLLWSKQFYHYVTTRLGQWRSISTRASRATQARPQQRLAASLQRRRNFHA